MRRPSEKRIRQNIRKLKAALKKEPKEFSKLQKKIESEERTLRSLLKPAKFLGTSRRYEKHRLLSKKEKLIKRVK